MTDCEDRPDLAQCQFECEMTLGIDNEKFMALLQVIPLQSSFICRCSAWLSTAVFLTFLMTALAWPGRRTPCRRSLPWSRCGQEDHLICLSQVAGSWWVVRGVNCGQDTFWTGGYDWYPCQHERWGPAPAPPAPGPGTSSWGRTTGSTTRPTAVATTPCAPPTRSSPSHTPPCPAQGSSGWSMMTSRSFLRSSSHFYLLPH